MPAQIFDLVDDLTIDPPKRDAIEQGADFDWWTALVAADVAGTTADDWSARMQVRRAPADKDTGEPLLDLDSEDLGGITVSIVDIDGDPAVRLDVHAAAATTEALPVGRWHYDVELVRGDGYVRRHARGRAQVTGEVTR